MTREHATRETFENAYITRIIELKKKQYAFGQNRIFRHIKCNTLNLSD